MTGWSATHTLGPRNGTGRGFKNLAIDSKFKEVGGAELGAMSTSTELEVAVRYAYDPRQVSQQLLLFKVNVTSFMERGADLQYLSAFPQEHELLFPPLTCLMFKNESVFFHQGIKISVVTVRPFFPS
jgi:hypothetical protein